MLFLHRMIARLPHNIVGPGLVTLIVKVASAALSYAMMVALAWMMSQEQYGYFGQGFNLSILLATVCAIGMPTAVMRYWPEYIKSGRPNLAVGFARAGFDSIALFCVGAVAIALLLSVSSATGAVLGFRDAPLAITSFACMVALSDYCAGLLRAQGKVTWAMVPRDVIWRALTPAFAFALSLAGLVLDARLALYSCALVLLVLNFAQMIVSRKLSAAVSMTGEPQRDWAAWRGRLAPFWAASVLAAMIQQLDVVVVGTLAGATEAGAYFVAQKTASFLGLVMIAGGLIGAPLMSAHFHSGRRQDVQKLCNVLAVAIAGTTAIGLIALYFAGSQLLAIFDPSYSSAYGILMILALGYTVDAVAGPNAYLMQMTSLETPYLKIMAGCYGLVLLAQVLLVPRYGGLGAAFASMAGIITWNVLAVWLLRTRHNLDPSILGLFSNPQVKAAATTQS